MATRLKPKSLKAKRFYSSMWPSRCGYTSHYEGLQSLYEEYQSKGLVIVGVPCNQFGGKNGTATEIDLLQVKLWCDVPALENKM